MNHLAGITSSRSRLIHAESGSVDGLGAAEAVRVLLGPEPAEELGQVLERLELGLAVRVVLGAIRPRVGLGHVQFGEQEGHRFDLPGRGWVGLRPISESDGSPAIDVNIPGIPVKKIHFP